MKVASLQFNPICENTYVVWDDTNECIVVDAGNSDEREKMKNSSGNLEESSPNRFYGIVL